MIFCKKKPKISFIRKLICVISITSEKLFKNSSFVYLQACILKTVLQFYSLSANLLYRLFEIQLRAMIRTICFVIVFWAVAAESYAILDRSRRNSDTCGVPKIKFGLIVQGEDFKRGSFPWVVALTNLDSRPPNFLCSGTIISRNFVISGNIFDSKWQFDGNSLNRHFSCALHSRETSGEQTFSSRHSCNLWRA